MRKARLIATTFAMAVLAVAGLAAAPDGSNGDRQAAAALRVLALGPVVSVTPLPRYRRDPLGNGVILRD